MAEGDLKIDRVRTYASTVMGRALNTARDQHFICDSSHGPAEAPNAVEIFLAGISSCGVQQAEIVAKEEGFPLKHAAIVIEGARQLTSTNTFERIDLHFELSGVNREQAQKIVEVYQYR